MLEQIAAKFRKKMKRKGGENEESGYGKERKLVEKDSVYFHSVIFKGGRMLQ